MLTSLPNYYKKLHQLARPSAVLTLALLPLPSLTQKTSKATFPFFLSPPNLPVSPFFLCWPILLFECEGQRCVLEDEKGNERLNSGEYSPLWISPPPWHFSAHLLCFVWLPPLLTHSHDLHAPLTPADSSTGRGSDRHRQSEYQQISWMVRSKDLWAVCRILEPKEFTHRTETGPPIFLFWNGDFFKVIKVQNFKNRTMRWITKKISSLSHSLLFFRCLFWHLPPRVAIAWLDCDFSFKNYQEASFLLWT